MRLLEDGFHGQRDMIVTESIAELRRQLLAVRRDGRTVGLVPTMGALHVGHASLMRQARDACGCVVATIFVNPTQFGPQEDFTKYPRTLEGDLAICRERGVDLVFVPTADVMYPEGFESRVDVTGLSRLWEGAARPGHFSGVATVVLKLFLISQPDVAFFGQKDFQQQAIIRRMCRDLDVPVDIRTCPTIREADGLALSSRNRYLSPVQRESAIVLSRALALARERIQRGETDLVAITHDMHRLMDAARETSTQYAAIVDPDSLEPLAAPQERQVALVAAKVGTTRLIDNEIILRRPA